MGGRRYEDAQNGLGKRVFRLEVLMYILLAKESLIPNESIPNFIMQAWRILF